MKKLNLIALLIFLAGLAGIFTLDTPTTRNIQAGEGLSMFGTD